MKPYDLARLIGLGSLWSLQYIFMRLAVPAFSTPLVAETRALFGALVVVPVAIWIGQRMDLAQNWRSFASIAFFNNVLPFGCFAYAALTLPAGYLSIINGTVPLWTALFAALALHERVGMRRAAGFALGLLGVALTVNLGPVTLDAQTLLASAAALGGAASWGLGGVMIKKRSDDVPAFALAGGTLFVAALMMSPAWLYAPQATWALEPTAALVALGVLCSGAAYFFFFGLVRDIGPSRTLSVTFTIPALGVLWGWLFLGEPVTASMLAGGALVLAAMAMVLRR